MNSEQDLLIPHSPPSTGLPARLSSAILIVTTSSTGPTLIEMSDDEVNTNHHSDETTENELNQDAIDEEEFEEDEDETDEYLMTLVYYTCMSSELSLHLAKYMIETSSAITLELELAIQNARSVSLDTQFATLWAEDYAELQIAEAAQAAAGATHLTATAEVAVRVAELLELYRREREDIANVAFEHVEDLAELFLIIVGDVAGGLVTPWSQAENIRVTLVVTN